MSVAGDVHRGQKQSPAGEAQAGSCAGWGPAPSRSPDVSSTSLSSIAFDTSTWAVVSSREGPSPGPRKQEGKQRMQDCWGGSGPLLVYKEWQEGAGGVKLPAVS